MKMLQTEQMEEEKGDEEEVLHTNDVIVNLVTCMSNENNIL